MLEEEMKVFKIYAISYTESSNPLQPIGLIDVLETKRQRYTIKGYIYYQSNKKYIL